MSKEHGSEMSIQIKIDEELKALKNTDKNSDPCKYAELNIAIGMEYHRLWGVMQKKPMIPVGVPGFEFGGYFHVRTKEEKEKCVSSSVEFLKKGTSSFPKDVNPIKWAKAHIALGVSYLLLSEFQDQENNIVSALEAIKGALTVLNKEVSPTDYAKAKESLGLAYGYLADIKEKEPNIELSIQFLRDSLSIFSKSAFPEDYGRIQINLGAAYSRLSQVKNTATNLQSAITALKEAQTVYTEEKYPEEFNNILKRIMFL